MSWFTTPDDDVPGDLAVILGLLLLCGVGYIYVTPRIWLEDNILNRRR